jgi:transposase
VAEDVAEERLTRHDLTDQEWARLEPLLPVSAGRGRPWADHRTVINGVFHRVRVGQPWRDLPTHMGWKTVYNRHRRWSGDGTWEEILTVLQAGCDEREGQDWVAAIDSTVVRAHQHAAGARHQPTTDIDPARLAPAVLSAPGTQGAVSVVRPGAVGDQG